MEECHAGLIGVRIWWGTRRKAALELVCSENPFIPPHHMAPRMKEAKAERARTVSDLFYRHYPYRDEVSLESNGV